MIDLLRYDSTGHIKALLAKHTPNMKQRGWAENVCVLPESFLFPSLLKNLELKVRKNKN
jgi:hypothetical protein